MKRLKIMLLSFVLLAIVGGALAFKAKNTKFYCTSKAEPSGVCIFLGESKYCPNPIYLTTAFGGTRFSYCYTTPLSNRLDCKQADGVTDLLCKTWTTSFREEDPQ
jgi:hypothetical protein